MKILKKIIFSKIVGIQIIYFKNKDNKYLSQKAIHHGIINHCWRLCLKGVIATNGISSWRMAVFVGQKNYFDQQMIKYKIKQEKLMFRDLKLFQNKLWWTYCGS